MAMGLFYLPMFSAILSQFLQGTINHSVYKCHLVLSLLSEPSLVEDRIMFKHIQQMELKRQHLLYCKAAKWPSWMDENVIGSELLCEIGSRVY